MWPAFLSQPLPCLASMFFLGVDRPRLCASLVLSAGQPHLLTAPGKQDGTLQPEDAGNTTDTLGVRDNLTLSFECLGKCTLCRE